MLDKHEWLADAKKLAIGAYARVYHGAEKRPNMLVRNLPDKYTAYCHRCQEWGVVQKEFVKVVQELAPATPSKKPILIPLSLDVPELNVPYKAIVAFLHSKDMTLDMLKHKSAPSVYWSHKDNRIVFVTETATLGRDITGRHPAKWYMYYKELSYAVVGDNNLMGKHVVLVEDYLSAIKGKYYLQDPNVVFIALLGTAVHNDLMGALTTSSKVSISLDNDDAGIKGAGKLRKRLNLLGVPNSTYLPRKHGSDPKNEQRDWFEGLLTR